ncbi:9908_t:CDS:2, partial [Cetraspora pellucida]
MVNCHEVLKSTLANGFGVIKFFKTMEYRFSQRDQAEKDLKKSLEEIASENGELSSKAQSILRHFDKEIIYNEKEEQHFLNLKSNIVMEHDIASNSLQIQIQKRFRETSNKCDSKKRIKIDDYFPSRSITPQTNISAVDLNPIIPSIRGGEDDEELESMTYLEEKDELTEDEFEK